MGPRNLSTVQLFYHISPGPLFDRLELMLSLTMSSNGKMMVSGDGGNEDVRSYICNELFVL